MNRTIPGAALALALAVPASLATEPPTEIHAGAAEDAPAMALAFSADDPALAWGDCPPFMPAGCKISVLHGDPAAPGADVFFKVPGGSEIPHHWHSSAERMVLVSGVLNVRYDGQPPRTLLPGMYAWGPPKLGHAASCAPGAECILFIAFDGPVDAVPTD